MSSAGPGASSSSRRPRGHECDAGRGKPPVAPPASSASLSPAPPASSASQYPPPFFSLRVVYIDYYLMRLDPWREPAHRARYGELSRALLLHQQQIEECLGIVQTDSRAAAAVTAWAGAPSQPEGAAGPPPVGLADPLGEALLPWPASQVQAAMPDIRVPVVRVFGATPAGQRAPAGSKLPFDERQDEEALLRLWVDPLGLAAELAAFENELEEAMCFQLFRRGRESGAQEGGGAGGGGPWSGEQPPPQQGQQWPVKACKVLSHLEVVQGTPLYGFHAQPELFIRVSLFDPRHVARLVKILETGKFGGALSRGRPFQTYESHFPFLLTVLVDLNAVGMGYVHLGNQEQRVLFRPPLPEAPSIQELKDIPPDPEAVDIRDRIWLAANTHQRLVARVPMAPTATAAAAAAVAATASQPVAAAAPQPAEGSLSAASPAEDASGAWLPGGQPSASASASASATSQSSSRRASPSAAEAAADGDGPAPPPGCSTQQRAVAEVMAGLTWSQLGGYQPTPKSQSQQEQPPPPPQGPGNRALRRMAISELELDADVRDVINPRLLPYNRRGVQGRSQHQTPRSHQVQQPERQQGQQQQSPGQAGKEPRRPEYIPSVLEFWEEEEARQLAAARAAGRRASLEPLSLTADTDGGVSLGQMADAFHQHATEAIADLLGGGAARRLRQQQQVVASAASSGSASTAAPVPVAAQALEEQPPPFEGQQQQQQQQQPKQQSMAPPPPRGRGGGGKAAAAPPSQPPAPAPAPGVPVEQEGAGAEEGGDGALVLGGSNPSFPDVPPASRPPPPLTQSLAAVPAATPLSWSQQQQQQLGLSQGTEAEGVAGGSEAAAAPAPAPAPAPSQPAFLATQANALPFLLTAPAQGGWGAVAGGGPSQASFPGMGMVGLTQDQRAALHEAEGEQEREAERARLAREGGRDELDVEEEEALAEAKRREKELGAAEDDEDGLLPDDFHEQLRAPEEGDEEGAEHQRQHQQQHEHAGHGGASAPPLSPGRATPSAAAVAGATDASPFSPAAGGAKRGSEDGGMGSPSPAAKRARRATTAAASPPSRAAAPVSPRGGRTPTRGGRGGGTPSPRSSPRRRASAAAALARQMLPPAFSASLSPSPKPEDILPAQPPRRTLNLGAAGQAMAGIWSTGPLLRHHTRAPTPQQVAVSLWPVYGLPREAPLSLHVSRAEDRGQLSSSAIARREGGGHHHSLQHLAAFDTAASRDMARRRRDGESPQQYRSPLGSPGPALARDGAAAAECERCQAAAELEQAPERAWRWWRDEWSGPSSPYPAGAFAAASLPPPPQPQAPVLLLRLCRRQPPAPRAVGRWLAEERAELALVETTPSPSGSQQEGAAGVDVMTVDPNTGQLVPRSSAAATRRPPRDSSSNSMQPPLPLPPRRAAPAVAAGVRRGLTSQVSPATPTPKGAGIRTPTSAERVGYQYRAPAGPASSRLPRNAEGNRLTTLSLELVCSTRLGKLPDPARDPVLAICFTVRDTRNHSSEHEEVTQRLGVLLNGEGLVLNAPGGQQRPSKPPALAAASSSSSARPQPATTAKQPCPHCQNAPDSGRFCIECAPRAAQQPPPPPSPSPNAPTGSSPFASPQPRYRRSDAAAMDPMWRRKQQAAQALKLAMGPGLELRVSPDERGLFDALVALVAEADPDFVVGWEVQMASLGYLLERAQHLGLFGLLRRLSRVRASWSSSAASDIPCPPPPPPPPGPHPQQQRPPPAGPAGPAGRGVEEKAEEEGPPAGQVGRDGIEHVAERRDDAWGLEQASGIWILGRTVLNLWRHLRGELKLRNYSRAEVVAHVLGRRNPVYTPSTLWEWWRDGGVKGRARVLGDVLTKARLNLDVMDRLDMVGRTSEMARVFGIDFYSVLTRGSQYRVEAVMQRVLKARNFIAISPTRNQVAGQAALEDIPLVMEPRSGFYEDPVAVLDFQSLYPSVIIAYNMCFSTIVGRLKPNRPDPRQGQTVERLGFIPYPRQQTSTALRTVAELAGDEEAPLRCFVSPSGAIFAPPDARRGVLPAMLREIIGTRLMIKKAIKRPGYKGNPVLLRVLESRQLSLKLLANVTYGYASASFSGRMPMAELADAIVSTGKATLLRAVHMANHPDAPWQPARVVYGDTDSMFVCLAGRGREQALKDAKAMAARATELNPPGVLLKFEKVYDGCVLVTKKRYAGLAFEEAGGAGHFDAKGIEVARRDNCPLVVKVQEKALRVLFETRDLSQVKAYVVRQLQKIHAGGVRVQDFIFATEVKFGHYAQGDDKAQVGSAIVAYATMKEDPRAAPRYKERVPYVVCVDAVESRVSRRVHDPHKLLGRGATEGLALDTGYYIEKVILPALERVLLCGVDVRAWYSSDVRRLASGRPIQRAHHRKRAMAQGGAAAAGGSACQGQGFDARFKRGGGDQMRITGFMNRVDCTICGTRLDRMARPEDKTKPSICDECSLQAGDTIVGLAAVRETAARRSLAHLHSICRACAHAPQEPAAGDPCVSLECPVFFERCRQEDRLLEDVEDLVESVRERFGEEGDAEGEEEDEGEEGGGGVMRLRLEEQGTDGEAERGGTV